MTPLRLYNTLTRRKEVFEPLEPGRVRIYSCGPTVYSRQHVGNLRAFLFADLLNRTLRYAGYDVYHVINVTDVGHLTDDENAGEDRRTTSPAPIASVTGSARRASCSRTARRGRAGAAADFGVVSEYRPIATSRR